jgi:hypothetical protein
VVSLLLWPRGASASVSKAIDQARAVGADFLNASVLRVTRGASENATDRVMALSHSALRASRTLDDAVRQYLSENGGPSDLRAPVVRAANRAMRVRAAAELIVDVVPPPLGVYEQTRTVIETHVGAICSRLLDKDSTAKLSPIGEGFVLALRAESAGSELAVSAALPLVTVAAHLGELELLYPQPAVAVGSSR